MPPISTAGRGIEIRMIIISNISILIFVTLKGGEKIKKTMGLSLSTNKTTDLQQGYTYTVQVKKK